MISIIIIASWYYETLSYLRKIINKTNKYVIDNKNYYTIIEPNHLFEGHGYVEKFII
jgi:hypothetical protein